jgi:hypothetical protein
MSRFDHAVQMSPSFFWESRLRPSLVINIHCAPTVYAENTELCLLLLGSCRTATHFVLASACLPLPDGGLKAFQLADEDPDRVVNIIEIDSGR